MVKYDSKKLISMSAVLGEGPLWNASEKRLFYVDIERHSILCYREEGGLLSRTVPDRVGCIVPAGKGKLVAGVTDRLVLADPETGEKRELVRLDLPAGIRFNDGKCDARGRLWIGTMAVDQSAPYAKTCGALYRIEAGRKPVKVLDGMAIPNGLAWSADNRTFYHIDTASGAVRAYPFDLESGTLGEGKAVVTIPKGEGGPDGMCIDAEGMLWIAVWGGRKVVRCNPATGERLAEVAVDALNVSCCCFGGENLDTLYITTARDEAGKGGEVFFVKTGVKGTLPYPFKLSNI